MRVVIPKVSLERHNACLAYLDSPEWNKEEQALVYNDWHQTVLRLLSNKFGTTHLDWLVSHKLVPMTADEFAKAREEQSPSKLFELDAQARTQTTAPQLARRSGHARGASLRKR